MSVLEIRYEARHAGYRPRSAPPLQLFLWKEKFKIFSKNQKPKSFFQKLQHTIYEKEKGEHKYVKKERKNSVASRIYSKNKE